ncbi:hypothetical protein [Kineothrix sp. MB12-C1]|uniref:hypothetical protein n=1 Tax=Kineothrix sp. MB12-C1 TaxID=3070215 RepID=UPI0027D2F4EF|nr:hypothetical protein [Kineothrix sp. MB12-C1]WMC91266.1 hypothetical protein RBB56_10255 [Kineothrix sp. MB12-C1]
MDIKIKELRKKIVDNMNLSDLPMEVKRLVLYELLSETTAAVAQIITEQLENIQEGETLNEQDLQPDQLGELSE